HIGYTMWQQPDKNIMPKIEEIEVPTAADMGVAIEGSEKWWPNEKSDAVLPEFNLYQNQPHFFAVFNRGEESFDYTVEVTEPWLLFGPVGDDKHWHVDKEQHAWVAVDWDCAPIGTHRVPITVIG